MAGGLAQTKATSASIPDQSFRLGKPRGSNAATTRVRATPLLGSEAVATTFDCKISYTSELIELEEDPDCSYG